MFGYITPFDRGWVHEFDRMQRDIDNWLGTDTALGNIRAVARGSFPAINVGATAERVDVYAFAPGLDPDTLEISLQNDLLTLSAERKFAQHENADYYLRERFSGAFKRVIQLPEDIDPEQVQARYTDGVLHISIARRGSVEPRRITVQ